MVKNEETWFWEKYWRFNRIASCFDTNGSNYPPEVIQEWEKFFGSLEPGAKILDVCTGNGAVARIGAEISEAEDLGFDITGIDHAAIDPTKFTKTTLGLEDIEFMGGIKAEDLPFPDNSFGAAVSQYGFEYTNPEKTIVELSRVLTDDARMKLICHTEDAVQTETGKGELELLDFILDDLALHQAAKNATTAVWLTEQDAGGEGEAKALLETFQAKMTRVGEKLKETPNSPFLRSTLGLLAHTFEVRRHFPLETLIKKINDAELEARAHRERISALVDVALSNPEVKALEGKFNEQGFMVVSKEPLVLENGTKLAGKVFEFERLA